MFELLIATDQRDGTTHAWTYYRHAIELAHAAQALDARVAERLEPSVAS